MNTAPLLSKVGAAVYRRRRYLKMSQSELASRCGAQRGYISSVERGEQNLTILSLRHIASALGMSITALVRDAAKEFKRVA